MASASVLSRTLQSITMTKIRELEKQGEKYESQKSKILVQASGGTTQQDRLASLLVGVRQLYPAADKDPAVLNIARWLQQSKYDASIPKEMLQSFEKQLRTKLDIQSGKLGLADLYSRLLTEWMNPQTSSDSSSEDSEMHDENSFEVLETQKQRLQQLCDKFESVVFKPLQTDEAEINDFMLKLFPSEESLQALERLRTAIKNGSESMLLEKAPFNDESLTKCIKGLLTEDLLSDDKQAILRDFLENKVVLAEIADVLNMRFADLENWDWHAGDEGIPVMPRQQLNGKYRIWMDEDVLQTIFVQYIGIRLCNLLKSTLKDVINDKHTWTWGEGPMTAAAGERRRYYLNAMVNLGRSVYTERMSDFKDTFFLSQLPATQSALFEHGGGYDDDGASEASEEDENESGDNQDQSKKSGIKQRLLRKVATEVLFNQYLRGKVAVVQSDLQWYATGLSHSTIFAVMRFVGFPDAWITFFKKYLESPLNMDHSSEDRIPVGPRIRKRGVPMAHASEKLLGELILFMMDLAVNRETGMLLYRLHDDLWLCGDPEKCARAWGVMQRFAKVMGLDYNMSKTGSIYLTNKNETKDPRIAASLPSGPVSIGFLTLDQSGDWVIDQTQVAAHIKQLQKQLLACDSVLSWVQTWNSCIVRFFSHSFGEPAYCFGPKHLDSILQMHKKMQEVLFHDSGSEGNNVAEHLKRMIHTRFGVSDVPDAFLFLPEQLGGLGLRNPFVSLFLVRTKLKENPKKQLEVFFENEKKEYVLKMKEFAAITKEDRRRRLAQIYHTPSRLAESAIAESEVDSFMQFEEFARYRETQSAQLYQLYTHFMNVPPRLDTSLTQEVQHALAELRNQIEPRLLDSEKKWILQMYADELFARYGGLSLVDKNFLPMGVLTMMRQKKVKWQTVL